MSNIKGMTFPEFKHMFEFGYVKDDPKEIIQELIDYIDASELGDPCAACEYEEKARRAERELESCERDNSNLNFQNSLLREQLRRLTKRIADLNEYSRELEDERVSHRSY